MDKIPVPAVTAIEIKGLKKGSICLIDGKPAKVYDITTSKPGKHGSTKCNISAKGLIEERELKDSQPSSKTIPSFTPIKTAYMVMDIQEAKEYCTLNLLDEATNDEVIFDVKQGSDPFKVLAKVLDVWNGNKDDKGNQKDGTIVQVMLMTVPVAPHGKADDDNAQIEYGKVTILDEVRTVADKN